MRVGYNSQLAPELKVWTQDQCHEMHLKSLEILERTGIIVHDEGALQVYKKGGAYVQGNKVFIPAWMVEEALRTAPERIVLRRKNKTVRLEENVVNYGLGTDLPFFQDYKTGQNRRSLLQDVREVARITDYLPNLDFVASLGIANDVTTQLADLHHFKAMYENSEKPLFMTATDKPNLQGLIDMAAVAVGGYEELKRNPQFLLYTEPISPLVNSQEAIQKLMLAAAYEIPVTYASGITSGATGPVTLAGNLTLGNAEGLAGLVLHQLVNPGAPFLYGIVAAPMDMATTICCYGGPEIPIYFCIVGEMGRYYKLPTFGQSGNSDSAVVDQQAAIEAMFSIFVAAQSGTNLVHDNGYIGNGLVGSLDMLVMCDECINMVNKYMAGMDVSAETLALDLIHQIGPTGSFRDVCKESPKWQPQYTKRKLVTDWAKNPRTMGDDLKDQIDYILKNHAPCTVSQHVSEEFDRIIADHEKRIAAQY